MVLDGGLLAIKYHLDKLCSEDQQKRERPPQTLTHQVSPGLSRYTTIYFYLKHQHLNQYHSIRVLWLVTQASC